MEIMKQYRDGNKQHDIVCLAGETLYQNWYSVLVDSCDLRHPSSTAGYFNSLEEAVSAMHKHRPAAVEITPETQNTKQEVTKMASIERKINGTFSPASGGYACQISEQTTLFVPACGVARYDPETGELYGFAPDYDALEAEKAPAVQADKPGEYAYCYEMQKAPTGCDFSADLSYYGKHYYLRPLRDGLPQLHGRGITYDPQRNTYTVTERAYDKLKEQYRIQRETCLD